MDSVRWQWSRVMSRKSPAKTPITYSLGWRLLRHPVTTMSVALVLLIALTDACWQEFREEIVDGRKLVLTADAVQINPPTDFFPASVVEDIKRQISANEPWLITPQLLTQTVAHVESFPSVQSVESAHKTASGIKLQVRYRQPVAKLELAPQRFWVIDQTGTVLVADVTDANSINKNLNLDSLLRVELRDLSGYSDKQPGEAWQDDLVVQSAAICHQLKPYWQSWKIFQLVSFCHPQQSPSEQLPWELWTRNGSKIIWSNSLATDNVPAIQKIDSITQWIGQNGPLSQIPLDQALDVRDGKAQLIQWHRPIR